jgi:hypothetical protein
VVRGVLPWGTLWEGSKFCGGLVAPIVESIEAMAVVDTDIKQCVCIILELAPYKIKRCFMHGEKSVERSTLLMLERVSRVHVRYALGHSDAVSAVPRHPPWRVSSYDMIGSGVLPTRTLVRQD